MGALIDRTSINANIVETGTYTMWHRIETDGDDSLPLFVGVGYFPDSQDTKGHAKANEELAACLRKYRDLGHVVFGGDLNAHTGLNGDCTPVDDAGLMLLQTVDDTGMLLINAMQGICTGGPTRVQVQEKGIQQSTLDYVMCSPSLASNLHSLSTGTDQMDSDHRPLFLTLHGLAVQQPQKSTTREVWDIGKIPTPPSGPNPPNWSWVLACRKQFTSWIKEAGGIIKALDASRVESERIADILDWSFQSALDEVADVQLGTNKIRLRPTPGLDATTRLLIEQRQSTQELMWLVNRDPDATDAEKTAARKHFMKASKAVRSESMRRRELAELALFRDVEAKQRDSKKFWGMWKRLKGTTRVDKSPPPVAENDKGEAVTDPVEVLKIWRNFSAAIACADLTGTDEYKQQVEDRLQLLRRARLHQPELDRRITHDEVWRTVRKLKLGKAPGPDGLLTDILKTAADGVGTSKIRGDNSVVTALCLLFNFVLEREVWPERWGTGVIFPLHKHDSRLDPSNFRPITLLSVVGKMFGIMSMPE